MSLTENKRNTGLDLRAPFRAVLDMILGVGARSFIHGGALIGAVSIIGFLMIMLAIDWLRPQHNWDTLAYLGVVARDWMGMTSPEAIHAFAYDMVRGAVKPEAFAVLTENDAYRERMASDPDAFVSMLGMYDVKWLYVALLALLVPMFGYSAGFIINCGAALLLSASVIRWLQATKMLNLGLVVPALLMVMGLPGFGMVDIPDFLTLALMTAAILALDRDRMLAGLVALVLAVLSRPDAVVFSGVLMAVAWFWRDAKLTVPAALAFVAAAAGYLLVKAAGTHPGWWPHFWFSTYHMENDLTGFDPAFSLKVYLTGLGWNLVRSALENSWLGLYALTLGGWALMQAGGLKLEQRRLVLVSALLTAIAVKFLIFPLHDGRVHMPFLFPAMLLLLAGLRDAARRLSIRTEA